MPLAIGTRVGPYEITGTLGAGGMGEVYRARDAKLNRDVALKVIADAFALDQERLARFRREAQVLASLNHPHIGAIYGLEDSGDTHALVLELVEGDTLADRIARGPLPFDEALPIARQIAEALEAAHEHGIIHRDLKPANIKVTPDGVVKVLDFGLAKLTGPAESGPHGRPDLSQSPTITSPAMMTGVGTLLGTAAYMSPEQAKGRPADKRSDVWAFGCVLYEMLTGARPFDGEDTTDVLGAVVRLEPKWDAIPSGVPHAVGTLLRGCLIKDRRGRVGDISTALFVLEQATSLAAPVGAAPVAPSPRTPLWRRVVAPTGAALIAAAVAGTAMWFATRPAAQIPPRVSRLTISSPPDATPTFSGNQLDLAITPDGSRVFYVGNRGTQLFVRELGDLTPVALFTGVPRGPFVSADGQSIGFVDGTSVLKRVAVSGGVAVTMGTLDGLPRGASWGADGTIVFATSDPGTGLQRLPVAGGAPTVLTRPDRAAGERDHLWPELLPGGRAVLFTITALTGGLEAARLAVLDLRSGTRTILMRGASGARYAPSGHLVYAEAGTLLAVPFDVQRLETRGTAVPVASDVLLTLGGGVYAAVAADGTLAYVSGAAAGSDFQRTLVWVDRQGNETPIAAAPRLYSYPSLSEAARIAVFANDQEQDIWFLDPGRPTLTRGTFDAGLDIAPVWIDAHRVAFSSDRAGVSNLWQTAEGSTTAERLTQSSNQHVATAMSPDGKRLIFTETDETNDADVMQVELDGTRRVTSLVGSRFNERNGVVSPDGRWLAYETDQSGRFEIFVRPFPMVNDYNRQVSTAGGTRPLWDRNGRELFYVSPTGAVMGVRLERTASWAATAPFPVVKEGYYTRSNVEMSRLYDIARDGRFLMIKGADLQSVPRDFVVMQNWFEQLKRLVPVD